MCHDGVDEYCDVDELGTEVFKVAQKQREGLPRQRFKQNKKWMLAASQGQYNHCSVRQGDNG